MQSVLRSLVGIAALALLSASTVHAQDDSSSPSGLGFGLKAGIGNDPTQVVLGAQFSMGKAALRLLRVIPNVQVGFGDYTTTDVNVDFLARIVSKGWGVYGGIAPTYTFAESDDDIGGTWIVGTQLPVLEKYATNLEARFGFSGAPKFRLMAVLVF